jgi:hypothetical protein
MDEKDLRRARKSRKSKSKTKSGQLSFSPKKKVSLLKQVLNVCQHTPIL